MVTVAAPQSGCAAYPVNNVVPHNCLSCPDYCRRESFASVFTANSNVERQAAAPNLPHVCDSTVYTKINCATNATPPSESSGISNLAALAVGLVILVLAIGLAFFMWRRSHAFPHGSLITSAMNELKHSGKNEDKDEEKHEEKQEETPIEEPAEKKPEKKFPPPMT